jgi:hypothetical protein
MGGWEEAEHDFYGRKFMARHRLGVGRSQKEESFMVY